MADAKTTKILVLKSSNNAFYNSMIDKLLKQPNKHLSFIVKNDKEPLQHIKPDLIVSLGKTAHLTARKVFPDIRKIFTFLTKRQSDKLKLKNNELSILLEQSTERLLSFTTLLFPNKIIAVPAKKEDTELIDTLLKNPSVIVNLVTDSADILQTINNLFRVSDVLLALPDTSLYNRYSLKGVLISSYRNQIPLVSYSPSHVKAGAIAAIYSSPENIAQQVLETINHPAHYEKPNGLIYSNYFSIRLNKRVAKSLQIHLPRKSQLVQQIRKQQQ